MARKITRTTRKAELIQAASRVRMPAFCDVCVVGGGAAGLVAAIIAAEQGARTVVVERDLECGRTILATGNGRCNLANTHLDPKLYNDPAFVRAVVGKSWLNDILDFFASCGLAWAEEDEGRLYPLSRQAASVRNVLLRRATASGVVLAPARAATRVARDGSAFYVAFTEQWPRGGDGELRAKSVVVALGGTAPTITAGLGLDTLAPTPLLCPLACTGPALESLDGRRARVHMQLRRHDKIIAQQDGEVLFRDYGLSGIATFNLSRFARRGDTIVLDLIPTLSSKEANELARVTLDGILDPAIARALMRHAGSIPNAIELAKELTYTVGGTTETAHAQVSRGGLSARQFLPATLEANDAPGLFACGEALNVDGPCGGFNLAWAWKSGMVAGDAVARKVLA